MILTCPSCGTRYVVKDGAIPQGGRTVRCAQCKHSWHQDADPVEAGEPAAAPDEASAEPVQHIPEQHRPELAPEQESGHPLGDTSGDPLAGEHGDHAHPDQPAAWDDDPDEQPLPGPAAHSEPAASELAEPEPAEGAMPAEATAAEEPYPQDAVPTEAPLAGPEPEIEAGRTSHPLRAARVEADDLYSPFADRGGEDDGPRRRWPLILGGLLLLIALAAAAIWFLAPPEFKSRLGLAQGADASRLTVQVQQHGRQQLASGNQLFEVSGVVINETDDTLSVPPLNAQLRSLEQQVVYRWTIPISPPQLAPGARTSFHSANLDIPPAAACLEVFFGAQKRPPVCEGGAATGA